MSGAVPFDPVSLSSLPGDVPPLRAQFQDPCFREAIRDYAPLAIGVLAWGTVAGVAMVKSGLPVPVAILMSLLVYAGSAQLTALPLMAAGAPMWLIWGAALCVNLRFVIFSVQWRPYFGHLPRRHRMTVGYFSGDTVFVSFMRRFPRQQPEPGQFAYFLGGAGMAWSMWQIGSIIGILVGTGVPASWGLEFAGTMALLGLLCALLTDRSTWVAFAVAGIAAVAAYSLPLKLNIVVAIAAAVTIGIGMRQADRVRAASQSQGPST